VDIRTISEVLDATVIEGEAILETVVDYVYASDLMSDVLAFGRENSILLTGLATQQAVISAHMAEFKGVVFVRGKRPKDGSASLAHDHHLILLSTGLDMYEACVRVGTMTLPRRAPAGITAGPPAPTGILLQKEFAVQGGSFTDAGLVSTEVKALLKKIGFDPRLVRRVAISTYEGEMNVVMHAERAAVRLAVTPELVEVTIDDRGKGIPDINLAMQAGYTTATEEMRAMGFGAGMGLPNIKSNTDELDIDSVVGRGTTLRMRFRV
jgi:serine/threonine-protein kinase RsbT